jgi:potassium-transporting ATPase KdpC subunit
MIKQQLKIAILFTLVTTVIFGVIYPLTVTALAQLLFPSKANGSLITKNGYILGSSLLGQSFFTPGYFYSRPSTAGTGYDASASAASNFAPTNHALIDRVNSDVARLSQENPGVPVPIDLVTTSASGLDPEITPAAAEFQVPRIARQRKMSEADVRALIAQHTLPRQFGFLGEPRVRVLELNLALDAAHPRAQ